MAENDNLIIDYVDLLLEAYEAASQVREFDTTDKSSRRRQEYAELLGQESDANIQLIEFVAQHAEELKDVFQKGTDETGEGETEG